MKTIEKKSNFKKMLKLVFFGNDKFQIIDESRQFLI